MIECLALLDDDVLDAIEQRIFSDGSHSENRADQLKRLEKKYENPLHRTRMDDAIKGYYYTHFELKNLREIFHYQQSHLTREETKYFIHKRRVTVTEKVDKKGDITTHYTFSSSITPLQQQLIIYMDTYRNKHAFKPFQHKEQVERFMTFLDVYYAMENRKYVYERYRYIFDHAWLVYFHVKGWEEYKFTMAINRNDNSSIGINIADGGPIVGLLDEEEILTYITEQSPMRLRLLFS